MKHPYSKLEDYNFWYKSMTAPAAGHIDPVVKFERINSTDKISTMGSCFAQNLARNISKLGFNYFVPEAAPKKLTEDEAAAKNFGVFSARYGNIYTARQGVQLFDRAFNISCFEENIWIKDGTFVDAYRPQIEPKGFSSKEELLNDRAVHLEAVRKIFLESDWLIFTLGLTEGWRSKSDGSIFPVAPGVSGGTYSENDFEFVNFKVEEVIQDLRELFSKVMKVNPKIKFLLTVSPVPLIATKENRHVWVSTTVSKSVLRVAADVVEQEFKNVIYFPSYEIITSPAAGGRYYADDLRQVTDIGVNHVMRVFSKHFLFDAEESLVLKTSINYSPVSSSDTGIICDEEEIEKAVKASGF
jgi:hypothetical protein